MLSRYQFEAIDRLMRDLISKDIPFGGKLYPLFIEPLTPIISLHLRSIVERFHLTRNMQANPRQDDFTSFLLEMGQGNLPLKNTAPFAELMEIPYHFNSSQNIVDDISTR